MMTTSVLPLVLVNEWLVSWHGDHCLSVLYILSLYSAYIFKLILSDGKLGDYL